MRHVPLFPLRSQPLGAPFAWGRCLAATRHSLGSHLTAAQPKLLSGGSAGAHAGTPPPLRSSPAAILRPVRRAEEAAAALALS